MIERRGPVPSRTVNFRQGMVTRAGPGLVPRRFVERCISLVIAVEVAQTQTQVVAGFAIVWIRIASRQTFNGFSEVRFGLPELTTPQMPQAHGIVASGVER